MHKDTPLVLDVQNDIRYLLFEPNSEAIGHI